LSETSSQPIAAQSTATHHSKSYFSTYYSSDDIVTQAVANSFSIMSTYSMTISRDSLYVFVSAALKVPERQGCARGHLGRRGCQIVCDYYCYWGQRDYGGRHSLGGRNLLHLGSISLLRCLFPKKLLKFYQWNLFNWVLKCLVG
jgi:hypothetical protein